MRSELLSEKIKVVGDAAHCVPQSTTIGIVLPHEIATLASSLAMTGWCILAHNDGVGDIRSQ